MMRPILFILLLSPFFTHSQSTPSPDAARIKLNLKKLNFLGSVLYVAAHPDDENTRIITSLANDRLAATAYLSMTRGDGGQNLIGSELQEQLGLIRTQELLAARRIDGGQQFFTRAIDFGFSKSADETFKLWNKEEVLADVVLVYRQFQPDIIITRFPPDERAGHGHHTASALLAQEAYDAASKSEVFPDQLTNEHVWQPKRLYTNTGRWWNTSIHENTPGVITLDVGGYNTLLGKSYTEVAAISRSQHKSQGFGSSGTRGYQPEFLEHVKGDSAQADIFEGINTSWSRVNGGKKIQTLVERALREFDYEIPSKSLPLLLQIRKEILLLEPGVWKTRKLKEVEQLIIDCAAVYVEATASHFWGSPGQTVKTSIEIVNRSGVEMTIEKIASNDLGFDSAFVLQLKPNIPVSVKSNRGLSASAKFSGPYWLREAHLIGLYTVPDKSFIGKPEGPPAIQFEVTLNINGTSITVTRPLIYKTTDPVKGEVTRPFEVVPPVVVSVVDPVLVFNSDQPREVNIRVTSTIGSPQQGSLGLTLPNGWHSEPATISFDLQKLGEEQVKKFLVYPAAQETTSLLHAYAEIGGARYNLALQSLVYDHIPVQTLLTPAEAKVVRLNLKKAGSRIGYIAGAGDEIPAALRNIGYDVWEMKDDEVTPENLKQMDAIVLGIRALNTNERMRFRMNTLLDYVKNGGTMVVQYNTNNNLVVENFSPYSITLSRNRVTEEDADVRILKPDHAVLNQPNKITSTDFSGWVQERGLYFPSKWAPDFEAILSMNDHKESSSPLNGGLLVAPYGNGFYVYTSLSFFRELPEGVTGAYKLFANLVSLKASTGEPVKKENERKTKKK